MILLLSLIFLCFGLIIGSFLNVVILRLNTQKSFGGRSGCMVCQHKLAWYELIPVFSFLGLQGRCKNCKTKISIQYPLVELATGFVFCFLFFRFADIFFSNTLTFSFTYAYYALIFSLLIVIATYDLKHKIIPDSLSFVFGALAFLGLFFFSAGGGSAFGGNNMFFLHLPSIFQLFSGPLIALPFFLFWWISSGRWMGLGDAKLALGIGWLLSFSVALSALFVAFWLGAIVGIMLVVFGKKYGMKSEIPFAPYLVFGTLLVFLFGLSLFPVI